MKVCRGSIAALSVGLSLFAAACGGISTAQLSDTTSNVVPPTPPYEKLSWYFQCPNDANPILVPQPTPNELILEGPGPFSVKKDRLLGTPVEVHGRICAPEQINRDIVFVIDVSGSTAYNDPVMNQTCGRLDAVKSVLAHVPAGVSNFAIVTFDNSIIAQSDKFYANETDLFTQITNGNPAQIADVLCNSISGTDYAVALNGAKSVLATGRENSTKEVFFVTDGEPNDETMAINAAIDLKTNGVTINGQQKNVSIATVGLDTGGFPGEQILRTIASNDTAGQPIFARVSNAGDLADTLTSMAENHLAGATVSYFEAGAVPTQIDVMPHLQTLDFSLPEFAIPMALTQPVFNVSLDYWDSHQNKTTITGVINWAP